MWNFGLGSVYNQIPSFCKHGDELSGFIREAERMSIAIPAMKLNTVASGVTTYTYVGTTGPGPDGTDNVRAGFRPGPHTREHVLVVFGTGSSETNQTFYETFRAFFSHSLLLKEKYDSISSCVHCLFVTQSVNKQPVQRTVTQFVRCELTSALQWDCTCV